MRTVGFPRLEAVQVSLRCRSHATRHRAHEFAATLQASPLRSACAFDIFRRHMSAHLLKTPSTLVGRLVGGCKGPHAAYGSVHYVVEMGRPVCPPRGK